MAMNEVIRITDYPRYTIDREGVVRNIETRRVLTPIKGRYPKVGLYAPMAKSAKLIPIHRLVAHAFVPNDNPQTNVTVNHIDGNTSNYCASNLEWCSQAENNRHARETGLTTGKNAQGTRVRRIDPTGNEPGKTYDSMASAARDVGIHSSGTGIQQALNHPTKTAAGYRWVAVVHAENEALLNLPEMLWKSLRSCDNVTFDMVYEVSSSGLVRNPSSGRSLHPSINHDGYLRVDLTVSSRRTRRFFVHRLVAAAFCPLPEEYNDSRSLDVDHIDGVRSNNISTNLRYITRGQHNQKTRGKPVAMKDPKTGSILATFPTITAAAKSVGICESGVRIALKRGSPRWALLDQTTVNVFDPEMDAFIDEIIESVTV
jgi:hypothetical protein